METVNAALEPEVVEAAIEEVGIGIKPENLGTIGLAFATGCAVAIPTYKYVVKPLVNKIKGAIENRRNKNQPERFEFEPVED